MSADKIRQQTVVSQVMEQIRTLIAAGEYKPGDKIPTEKELAERFGIGRSSIREAIKIFSYLGVFESKAALGTFVQDRSSISSEAITWSLLLGSDELEEIIDLRGAVELWTLIGLVEKYCIEDARAIETIAELEGIVSTMLQLVSEGLRDALIEQDYAFHRTIIESSQIPLFISIYSTLGSFMHDEIQRSQEDYDDPSKIHAEHLAILDVIKGGDPSLATEIFTAHIENIKIRVRNSLARSRRV